MRPASVVRIVGHERGRSVVGIVRQAEEEALVVPRVLRNRVPVLPALAVSVPVAEIVAIHGLGKLAVGPGQLRVNRRVALVVLGVAEVAVGFLGGSGGGGGGGGRNGVEHRKRPRCNHLHLNVADGKADARGSRNVGGKARRGDHVDERVGGIVVGGDHLHLVHAKPVSARGDGRRLHVQQRRHRFLDVVARRQPPPAEERRRHERKRDHWLVLPAAWGAAARAAATATATAAARAAAASAAATAASRAAATAAASTAGSPAAAWAAATWAAARMAAAGGLVGKVGRPRRKREPEGQGQNECKADEECG